MRAAAGTTGGAAAVLFSFLNSYSFDQTNNLPVVKINSDDSLLAHWPSEEFHAPFDAAPECAFWNFSVQFDATLCNHFTIGRTASTPSRALDRALACAGRHGTECILSPEIGLALPAAFVMSREDGASFSMVLGPRLLPLAAEQQHVRVATPGTDELMTTKTFLFNRTVRVEYLDGATRRMATSEWSGDSAYCIQLLREAFSPGCWEKLD